MDTSILNNNICKLMDESPLQFHLICRATKNDPCDGCFHKEGGMCPGYQLMAHGEQPKRSQIAPVMTNKEIAEKLGVSKREVSRMRKNGTLPPGIE